MRKLHVPYCLFIYFAANLSSLNHKVTPQGIFRLVTPKAGAQAPKVSPQLCVNVFT